MHDNDVLVVGRRGGVTAGIRRHAAIDEVAIVCYTDAQKQRFIATRDAMVSVFHNVKVLTLAEVNALAEEEQATRK